MYNIYNTNNSKLVKNIVILHKLRKTFMNK